MRAAFVCQSVTGQITSRFLLTTALLERLPTNYNHSPKPDWHAGPVRSPTGRLPQCDSSDLSALVSFKTSIRRVA